MRDNDPIDSEDYKGVEIKIYPDHDSENPREWGNVSQFICRHRNYKLGDKHDFDSGEAIIEHIKEIDAPVIIGLVLYDHSGITIRGVDLKAPTNPGKPFECDPAGWDTSHVGYAIVTREAIKKEYGAVNKDTIAQARKMAFSEIAIYDQYLRGDVYGYVIEGEVDGLNIEGSCWGFYGIESAKAEARGEVLALIKSARKEAREAAKQEREEARKIDLMMAI